jgi:hypothetical protein
MRVTVGACDDTSGSAYAINSTSTTVSVLGGGPQRDDRQMRAIAEVVDVQFESDSRATADLGRRPGTGRGLGPQRTGFEASWSRFETASTWTPSRVHFE